MIDHQVIPEHRSVGEVQALSVDNDCHHYVLVETEQQQSIVPSGEVEWGACTIFPRKHFSIRNPSETDHRVPLKVREVSQYRFASASFFDCLIDLLPRLLICRVVEPTTTKEKCDERNETDH